MKSRTLMIAAITALLAIPVGAQQFKDENLLFNVPSDYIQDYTDQNKTNLILEWVPDGQSVENWEEMLTVQLFFGPPVQKPGNFAHAFIQSIEGACEGGEGQVVKEGLEQGYKFAFFLAICPENPATGKPEFIWLKAIAGRDALYVVQKAWKYHPTNDEIEDWSKYLAGIAVCDTRTQTAPCP